MEKIYTIGYEGKTPDEFLNVLKRADISIVIDVRENPASRKKGFSKTALSELLNQNGISYSHLIQLGNPKEFRDEYKKDGDLKRLLERYRAYLAQHPEHVETLLKTADNDPACLMCFEKLPTQCHRNIIAEYLYVNRGMAINHL